MSFNCVIFADKSELVSIERKINKRLMKEFKNAMRKISSLTVLVVFILLSHSVTAQGNYESGAKLFDANCSSCHAGNLTKDATGPALRFRF